MKKFFHRDWYGIQLQFSYDDGKDDDMEKDDGSGFWLAFISVAIGAGAFVVLAVAALIIWNFTQ